MQINAMSTVRDLAVAMPGAIPVFERLGIDYCCGGNRTLADACQTFHVPFDEALLSLENAARQTPITEAERDWRQEPLAALTAHIVNTHHVFTNQELERLEKLLDKVCARHSAQHPELARVQEVFLMLKADLLPHLMKEERILFPHIEQMEGAKDGSRMVPLGCFGTVQNPVRMMSVEHDAAGDLLREMRLAANDYVLPADACISYQMLYQGLQAFEADLHQHIHLENNLLFPRAIQLEQEL